MKKGREYIIYTDKLRFTQCDKGFFSMNMITVTIDYNSAMRQ